MEFKKYKLGELCRLSSSKRIFESEYVNNGIPFIRGQEISDKSILDENSKFECYISEERYNEIKEKYGVPQKGDILMTAVGTIGNLVVLNSNRPFYFKDGNVIRFSDFSELIDSTYLALFMKSPYFNKQIQYALIGAVQKALTMVMLSNIEIPLPEISIQKRIATILMEINSKIETNKKINKELEVMAKELYDYWFVQFDFPNEEGKPYKSSGGKMVWNDVLKREIPEGWKIKSIFDAADVIYGYPYSTEHFDEDVFNSEKPYSIIRIRDILENSVSAKTDELADSKYITKKKDLLIGMDGYFHMNFWAREGDYVNQRITRIRKTEISTMIIYYQILPFIKHKEKLSKGSTVGHLSDKDMKQIYVLIPNNKSLSTYFDNILDMKIKVQNEIQELINLRDELLPMLMNGQVTIK